MRIESNSKAGALVRSGEVPGRGGESFGIQLSESLSNLAHLQAAANKAAESAALGDLSKLQEAVIAMQKASLALEFAINVRNQMVEGLQELLHTQL